MTNLLEALPPLLHSAKDDTHVTAHAHVADLLASNPAPVATYHTLRKLPAKSASRGESHPRPAEAHAWQAARRDPERGLQSWFRPAKPETRNPKPTVIKLVSNCETRNPKPETDSEDLTSPGPIETRNPKPTLKTYLPQDRSKPETRNRL